MNTQNHGNTPAIPGAMQAAIHSANILSEQKNMEQKKNSPMLGSAPAIVPRRDLLGNRVLFLADTQNRETGSIQYWDGKKGSKLATAPLAFYKSTKPIDSEEEVKKFVQDYSKEFGQKEFILRQRLIKGSVLERDEDGKVDKVDVEALKVKLMQAFKDALDKI